MIPVRYLIGLLMCLQFFVGPALAYNGLDQYQLPGLRMQIDEADYFSFIIPAVCIFFLGLHANAGFFKGEVLDVESIRDFVRKHALLPYYFVGIGFAASLVSGSIPQELANVLYIISLVRFVGLFMLLLAPQIPNFLVLILILGFSVSGSMVWGMFHDLLIWLIFTGAILAIRFKFSKTVIVSSFVLFAIVALAIQILKPYYRTTLRSKNDGSIAKFEKVYSQQVATEDLFSLKRVGASNVRINQGYIITHIMKRVPASEPFAYGSELKKILESALLPRFLAPNKLQAGDRSIFYQYTGILLNKYTAMGLSSVGDAYVNFGKVGACIFLFLLGLFYNWVLKTLHRFSKYYPVVLLFVPVLFLYAVRPDCELQTALGHLVKSSVILALGVILFRTQLYYYPPKKHSVLGN